MLHGVKSHKKFLHSKNSSIFAKNFATKFFAMIFIIFAPQFKNSQP